MDSGNAIRWPLGDSTKGPPHAAPSVRSYWCFRGCACRPVASQRLFGHATPVNLALELQPAAVRRLDFFHTQDEAHPLQPLQLDSLLLVLRWRVIEGLFEFQPIVRRTVQTVEQRNLPLVAAPTKPDLMGDACDIYFSFHASFLSLVAGLSIPASAMRSGN